MSRTQHVSVEPSVLRWARESMGLTVEHAAKGLGVSAGSLVRWESEATEVSITTLERLAQVYRRPLAAFFLQAPPAEPAALPDFRAIPTTRSRPLDATTHLAIRRARRVQILAADLLNARRASIGSASPQDAAEGIAATARASLNVPMPAQLAWADQAGALNAWKVAVEGVGVLVLELRFAMRDARAFSLGDRRPPVVVLNSRDAGVAKPFSLFHEYGHLLLGEGGLCDLEDPGDGTQVHSIEAFCNRFAAAVLLPEEAFAAQMRVIGAQRPWSDDAIEKLARRFRVSRHTVFLRMVTLGLATSADYRRRSAAWEADRAARVLRSGGRNVPAARCLRENGLTFTSAVLASEGSGRITRRDVADFLAVKVKYLGDVERRLSQAARTA